MHAKKSTISLTHIKEKSKRKTNPSLSTAILLARKQKNWISIAHKLSGPTRVFTSINLNQIDSQTKAGDTIIVVGKILSSGKLTKKVRICALSISNQAKDKLKDTKSEFVHISEEIKKNPKAEGLKVLT